MEMTADYKKAIVDYKKTPAIVLKMEMMIGFVLEIRRTSSMGIVVHMDSDYKNTRLQTPPYYKSIQGLNHLF